MLPKDLIHGSAKHLRMEILKTAHTEDARDYWQTENASASVH
jgi:hypothetical protein